MEKCIRCKREFGMGSVVPVKVEANKVLMVHFWCATPNEVKNLYGKPDPVFLALGGATGK